MTQHSRREFFPRAMGMLFGFSVGFLIGPLSDKSSTVEKSPVRDSLSRNGGSLAAQRSDLASIVREFEILGDSERNGRIARTLLRSASERDLEALVANLSRDFWKKTTIADELLRAHAFQVLGPEGMGGLLKGVKLIAESGVDGEPNILYRALLEGCFAARLPPVAEMATFVAGRGKEQAMIAAEAYLRFCPQNSLSELGEIGRAIGKGHAWMTSKPDGIQRLDQLVSDVWLCKGEDDLRDLLSSKGTIPIPELNAVRRGMAHLTALHPSKAKRILKAVSEKSPAAGGDLFSASALPLREAQETVRALSESQKQEFYSALIRHTAKQSPLELLDGFQAIPARELPESVLPEIARLALSPMQFARWVTPLGPEKAALLLDAAAATHGWADPVEANDFLRARLALGGIEVKNIVSPLREVARWDLQRALDLVNKLPGPLLLEGPKIVYSAIAVDAAINRPDQYRAVLDATPPEIRTSVLAALGRNAHFIGGGEAIALATSLPANEKAAFIDAVLMTHASPLIYQEIPIQDRASMILDLLNSPAHLANPNGVAEVVQRLVGQNLHAAGDFVAHIPSGAVRDKAVHTLMERWAELDPASACDWADQLRAGPERDAAIASVVGTASDQLEVVLASIKSIHDPAIRIRALRTLRNAWLPADPGYFQAAVEASGIDHADKVALRNPPIRNLGTP